MRCIEWCGVELTDKLEKLQLEALRIAPSVPADPCRDSLYIEIV